MGMHYTMGLFATVLEAKCKKQREYHGKYWRYGKKVNQKVI